MRTLTNRVTDPAPPRRRRDLLGAMLGGVAGLIIGLVVAFTVWGAESRSEYEPGTHPCAAAAERWAQLDATWRLFTGVGTQPLTGNEPAAMDDYKARAMTALEDCRAAG